MEKKRDILLTLTAAAVDGSLQIRKCVGVPHQPQSLSSFLPEEENVSSNLIE